MLHEQDHHTPHDPQEGLLMTPQEYITRRNPHVNSLCICWNSEYKTPKYGTLAYWILWTEGQWKTSESKFLWPSPALLSPAPHTPWKWVKETRTLSLVGHRHQDSCPQSKPYIQRGCLHSSILSTVEPHSRRVLPHTRVKEGHTEAKKSLNR